MLANTIVLKTQKGSALGEIRVDGSVAIGSFNDLEGKLKIDLQPVQNSELKKEAVEFIKTAFTRQWTEKTYIFKASLDFLGDEELILKIERESFDVIVTLLLKSGTELVSINLEDVVVTEKFSV